MSVFELAGLKGLRRLSLVRVHKLTDIAILFLAEHALLVERLHLAYCDRLSLQAIQFLLRKLEHLEHLTATGVPSCRRKGIQRFSDTPPQVCRHYIAPLLRFRAANPRPMTVTKKPHIGFSMGKMLHGCGIFLRRKNDERGKLKLRISPSWPARMIALGFTEMC